MTATGANENGIVVMKFGGTSVADAEHIISAAKRMVRARSSSEVTPAVEQPACQWPIREIVQ